MDEVNKSVTGHEWECKTESETPSVFGWSKNETHLVQQELKGGILPDYFEVKMMKDDTKDDGEIRSSINHY